MSRLRTALFDAAFFGGSVPYVLASPIAAAFGRRALVRHVRRWARFHSRCARLFLGIGTRVEGAPAAGPVLYAVKHQAMYETFELTRLLEAPAIVLKRELARIPFWGPAAQRYGCIVVDRAGSAAALRTMLRDAKSASAAGQSVVIFPEGTRVPPGEQPPLQPGFAGLYRGLGLPVVPIAVDSGRLWPKRGPKRAGVVTMRFGEPIPPGLPRGEAEARVHAAINALDEAPGPRPD